MDTVVDNYIFSIETLGEKIEDLTSQVTEAIETYRDLLTDQLNIYNSVIANKMNDIIMLFSQNANIGILAK